jgi:hypothetical protein
MGSCDRRQRRRQFEGDLIHRITRSLGSAGDQYTNSQARWIYVCAADFVFREMNRALSSLELDQEYCEHLPEYSCVAKSLTSD